MRLCREIGCPHPNQFEKFGIGVNEIMDWWAFYVFESERAEGKESGEEKVAMMNKFRKQWGK